MRSGASVAEFGEEADLTPGPGPARPTHPPNLFHRCRRSSSNERWSRTPPSASQSPPHPRRAWYLLPANLGGPQAPPPPHSTHRAGVGPGVPRLGHCEPPTGEIAIASLFVGPPHARTMREGLCFRRPLTPTYPVVGTPGAENRDLIAVYGFGEPNIEALSQFRAAGCPKLVTRPPKLR